MQWRIQAGKVPGPYLAMLEEISATALVVVLSVPTFREKRHPESCAKVLRGHHDLWRPAACCFEGPECVSKRATMYHCGSSVSSLDK